MEYLVNFSAIYNVTVEVEATSPEEAIKLVRSGDGSLVEEAFDRQHPDTEFFVRMQNEGTDDTTNYTCDYNHYAEDEEIVLVPAAVLAIDANGEWTPLCKACLPEFYDPSQDPDFTSRDWVRPLSEAGTLPLRLQKLEDR